MAWTAPKTWVLDELVDESDLNTHVRDNLLALRAESEAALAVRSTNGSLISAATWQSQPLDGQEWDTYAGFTPGNAYIVVPPISGPALILVSFSVVFSGFTGTGTVGARVTRKTSADVVAATRGTDYGTESGPAASGSAAFNVDPNDRIYLEVWSNMSGTNAVVAAGSALMVRMVRES